MKAILLFLPAMLCAQTFSLESAGGLKFRDMKVEPAQYKGRKAIRAAGGPNSQGEDLIVVSGTRITDGTIEAEIAGRPGEGAAQAARGFVGVAFRVKDDLSKYDVFYIRPTNGRAEDQERRNHAAQYISFPGFPWEKLRKETPGKYEAYVDLQPGEWTKVKVEVKGATARLFVHGNAQPTMIVNDLKGEPAGAVGLWVGSGTEAHFSNLRITK